MGQRSRVINQRKELGTRLAHFEIYLSRHFLYSVIVEDIIVGLCTCTCTYKKAMVYYSIVFCCGMKSIVQIVTMHKDSIHVLSAMCVTPILSYINLNIPIV